MSNNHRFAILIDGGFFLRKLQSKLKKSPGVEDVMAHVEQLRHHDKTKSFELLRAYYYDAEPATGKIVHPITKIEMNLAETPVFTRNKAFLQKLELQENISLRLGELSARGYKVKPTALNRDDLAKIPLGENDFVPDIEQKGVDLRIGLDIARLSLRGLVETIVVVTGDSDLIPAFKFARREGVRILLSDMGHGVKRELKAHTDGFID